MSLRDVLSAGNTAAVSCDGARSGTCVTFAGSLTFTPRDLESRRCKMICGTPGMVYDCLFALTLKRLCFGC